MEEHCHRKDGLNLSTSRLKSIRLKKYPPLKYRVIRYLSTLDSYIFKR